MEKLVELNKAVDLENSYYVSQAHLIISVLLCLAAHLLPLS